MTARKLIGFSLVSVGIHALLLAVVPGDGGWVEVIYVQHLYPLIGNAVAAVPALLPFSVLSVITIGLLIWAALFLLGNFIAWRRGRLSLVGAGERTLAGYLLVLAAIFHSFYFFWGYNYLRSPIEQRFGLDPASATAESRQLRARQLVEAAAAARVAVEPWNRVELDALIDEAIATALQELEGRAPPVVAPLKQDLPAGLFAAIGIRGKLSPFTLEPHVDFRLPPMIVPFTAAHEKAHLAGIAGEADANFVAWYALTRADDPRLRYAGYLGIVSYFFNAETRPLAAPLREDLAALRAYSANRVSPRLQQGRRQVQGIYLRANRVQSGLQDYSRVAELIDAYLASRGLTD